MDDDDTAQRRARTAIFQGKGGEGGDVAQMVEEGGEQSGEKGSDERPVPVVIDKEAPVATDAGPMAKAEEAAIVATNAGEMAEAEEGVKNEAAESAFACSAEEAAEGKHFLDAIKKLLGIWDTKAADVAANVKDESMGEGDVKDSVEDAVPATVAPAEGDAANYKVAAASAPSPVTS